MKIKDKKKYIYLVEDSSPQIEIGRKPVVIRFPIELLHKLDAHLNGQYGMNRTVWILQAIQEKLERENES